MADAMRDRLVQNAHSLNGILSLLPAKMYYREDNSDQWKKKKQTKEQATAAQRAKLNPESRKKNPKEILDENAKKRKLEELDDESDVEGIQMELPRQGLKQPQDKMSKKQKTTEKPNEFESSKAKSDTLQSQNQNSAEAEAAKLAKAEQKSQKQQRKKERQAKKQENKKARKEQAASQAIVLPASDETKEDPAATSIIEEAVIEDDDDNDDKADDEEVPSGEMVHFDAEGLEEETDNLDSSAAASPTPPSPTFDHPSEPSANTSTSSVIPPAKAPKHIKIPSDPELLKARLAARIEALRAARKADGPDGAPARNRQELMEARRKKEEQRRAHKKEVRLRARAEEDAKREAALASARDSPASSMMSPAIHSPEHNFSFGRVAFADGQTLADDLSTLRDAPKKRGPQDPETALKASENKRLRIAGLDDEKRADIEEKDLWLNAKKRAHGEKVRDDTSLLKKTLKRKEKQKQKSAKEWGDRKEGIAKSQAIRQKKREENLQKRKDGSKKGKAKVKAASGGKPKVKSRPGFEGSFGGGKKRK